MRNLMQLLVALSLCTMQVEASNEICRVPGIGPEGAQGPQGATGPQGPQGPTGPVGSPSPSSHIFTFKAAPQLVSAAGTVVFDTANVVSSGSAVTFNGTDTFTITQTGVYAVNFVGYIFNPSEEVLETVFPGFRLFVNGTPVGPNAGGAVSPRSTSPAVLYQMIEVTTAPKTVTVTNTSSSSVQLGVSANPVSSAMIEFIQLSTP